MAQANSRPELGLDQASCVAAGLSDAQMERRPNVSRGCWLCENQHVSGGGSFFPKAATAAGTTPQVI